MIQSIIVFLVTLNFSLIVFSQESSQQSKKSIKDVSKTKKYKIEKIQVSTSAEKLEKALIELPIQVDLISEEEILKTGASTLKSILVDQSNVEFTGGPRATIQKPQIRGLGEDRVLIVMDGVKQSQGSIHRGNVFSDLSLFKSVEVIKGSSSPLYGSNAMGGVIAFERKMADDYLAGSNNLGAELGSKYSSASNAVGTSGVVYGKGISFGIVSNYSYKDTDDIRLGDGEKLEYSSTKVNSVGMNAYYTPNKAHRFDFFADRFEEQGLWPSNPGEDLTRRNYLADTENIKESFQLRHKYNPQSQLVHSYLNAYTNKVVSNYEKEAVSAIEQNSTHTHGFEAKNISEWAFDEKLLTLTYGFEYIQETNIGRRNGEKNGKYPDGQSELTSLYLQPSFEQLEDFRIVPGIRYDRYFINSLGDDFDYKLEDEVSSKLALMYFVNSDWSLYSSYGEAFRAPKIQDVYANGEHYKFKIPKTGQTVVNNFLPNPDLSSETSQTYELGTHFKKENKVKNTSLSFDASLYRTQAKDFVDQELITDMFGNGTTQFVNRDRVEIHGGELALSGKMQRVDGRISYTHTESKDLNTEQSLVTTPGHKTTLSGGVLLSQNSKLKVGTSFTHFASKDNVVTPEGSVFEYEDYFTQDLFISWEPQLKVFERTRLSLRVNNIHDKEFSQHGSLIPGVGRDVRLSLTVNL